MFEVQRGGLRRDVTKEEVGGGGQRVSVESERRRPLIDLQVIDAPIAVERREVLRGSHRAGKFGRDAGQDPRWPADGRPTARALKRAVYDVPCKRLRDCA